MFFTTLKLAKDKYPCHQESSALDSAQPVDPTHTTHTKFSLKQHFEYSCFLNSCICGNSFLFHRMKEFSAVYDDVCKDASRHINETLRPFDKIDTIATHGGYDSIHLQEVGRPVVPPLTLSTTFQQLSPGVAKVMIP